MQMNLTTKLVYALEHIAHLHDLLEGTEYETHLLRSVHEIEYELERQLSNEKVRTGRQLAKRPAYPPCIIIPKG